MLSSTKGPLIGLIFTFFFIVSLFPNIISSQQEQQNNASISAVTPNLPLLGIRQSGGSGLPEGACTKEIPCANEACCNGETGGAMWLRPQRPLLSGKSTSKCKSKAECGRYADPPGLECPIHVCCSKHGFCGTLPDFCEDDCQSNCGQPAKTSPYTADVRELVIGYVEAWAFTRRGCAQRDLSSIRVDSVTHIYASFAYIKPNTFEVYPMGNVNEKTLFDLTNLKRKAPGLKVWIALGGWTYSDNGTDTQPVWGDLASSPAKREKFLDQLEKFMIYYGFDGVDYDCEYPGATDRGGQKRDGGNYVELLKATRLRFSSLGRGSFTAPSSLWYMRHFHIEDMMAHVDWVNLMTYDLFGSWDKESNWIGPKVYAHNNLTEIKNGLNLLWRNNVPANQVNLGLGFYGRTYLLSNPSCDKPGCRFEDAGRAGPCSGEGGYLSYQDIVTTMKMNNPHVVTDKKDAVKYFRYDSDQWVSFDDQESLDWKVKFANEQGLRGLFIWAITQDTAENDLLKAVLGRELGRFKDKNGVHSDIDSFGDDNVGPDQCVLSRCDGKCKPGLIEIGSICCPIGAAYNPNYCKWRANKDTLWCGGATSVVKWKNKCGKEEDHVVSSDWFIDGEGRDDADYCCAQERENVCAWNGDCLGPSDKPDCGEGRNPLDVKDGLKSVRRGLCLNDDGQGRVWEVLCCENPVQPDCRWLADEKDNWAAECSSDEVNWGRHPYGGGKQCQDPRYNPRDFYQDGKLPGDNSGRLLCCKRNSARVKVKKLPVPVEYLFDEKIDSGEEQEYDIDVDIGKSDKNQHPNENSFSWHIMSGPASQLTNLNKRDGSHWEVYDCDPAQHEEVQTARLVCTKGAGEDHNCDAIHQGGVPDTVLEMPPGCGAGKYALAISLKPMAHDIHSDDKLPRLVKRKLSAANPKATIYKLTFDYGFHRLQGRADNNVKLRIDYSNAKDYWNLVVAAKPTKRSLSSIEHEVHTSHAGSWKRYLEHTYNREKNTLPLHELEARWHTADAVDWIARLGKIKKNVDVLDQRIAKTFTYVVLDEWRTCSAGEFSAKIEARIKVDIQTSGVITLIGRINDMKSFRHSYVNFRNRGDIKASLSMNAKGELKIPHKEDVLFGIAPMFASFKVPGVVTIGPEFKLAASMEGKLTVEATARVDVEVESWDYSQRYPAPSGNDFDDNPPDKPTTKPRIAKTDWQLTATGLLAFHLIPMVTFGVVFDPKWGIPSAAFYLGVDTYARFHGFATIGKTTDFTYCVGAEAGYDVFARVTAPTLFKVNLNRQWSLLSDERSIFSAGQCPSNSRRRDVLLRRYLEDIKEGDDGTIPVVPLLEDGVGEWVEDLDTDEEVEGVSNLTHEQLRVRRQAEYRRKRAKAEYESAVRDGPGVSGASSSAAAEPVISTEAASTGARVINSMSGLEGMTPIQRFAFVSDPFSPL
ncbi:glycoside hydrolase [Rhypophila decipiens]